MAFFKLNSKTDNMVISMIDASLKILLSIILLIWLYNFGTIFESEYHEKLVNLYTNPWWRWMLVGLLVISTEWCPSFAIALLMSIFFYFADINSLVK
jgi:hypothetical protein